MTYIISNHTYTFNHAEIAGFALLAIWSLIWKGLALWRAGRNKQTAWFVIMLILNTAGILEIIYLLFFSKKTSKK